jgi:predicted alpha/beta-fold hydrolase
MRALAGAVITICICLSWVDPASAFINRQKDYVFPYANPYLASLTSAILKPRAQEPIVFELPGLPGRDHVRFAEGRDRIKIALYKQSHSAPLLYLIPGVAGSATSGGALWLAEYLASKGFSVITVPSPLNWRFIVGQSSTGVAGFSPEDAKDLRRVMSDARSYAQKNHDLRVSRAGVMGYSLGGLNAAFVMKLEREKPLLGLERAVMINPPLHLPSAMKAVDSLDAIGASFSVAYREALIGRVTDFAISTGSGGSFKPERLAQLERALHLTLADSKYLIGSAFRGDLADDLFIIEEVAKLGLLKEPVSEFRRNARQAEARRTSFERYMTSGVFPFWTRRLKVGWSLAEFIARADLLSLKELFARDSAFRLVHNDDDFLTRAADLAEIADGMNERAIIYPRGGHIGSLWNPRNLADLYSMVADLR